MSTNFEITINQAKAGMIAAHLHACDSAFVPPLSSRVAIDDYVRKIASRAVRFEAWAGEDLVGLVATYCDTPVRGNAFLTNVSVLPEWQGKGIASRLIETSRNHVRALGFSRIDLELAVTNQAAMSLYQRCGFTSQNPAGPIVRMTLYLERTPE